MKWIRIGPAGIDQPRRGTLAYLDCGGPAAAGALQVVRGSPWNFGGAQAALGTCVFDTNAVVVRAQGLDPAKTYRLGLSWWDASRDGRVQSVLINGTAVLERHRLTGEPEERMFEAKPDAAGAIELRVRRDETVNAVLSEVWLLDPAAPAPPAPPEGLFLETRSDDPVGHGVKPGERYAPDDAFYIDFSTPDPFEALERYGLAVRAAQGARPNPYTFPTVCSWYAGVWTTPGAQNHPGASRYGVATTAGQVGEMDAIRRMGFLSFSPVALRLVPDNYTEINQNGWWDDAHWRKEGFYTEPCETTKKWCDAIRARGGLPFTYIQPTFYASDNGISKDFREAHPDWMLGNDPARTIDYSDPGAQAYVRARFKALGDAGLAGLMIDYCDDLWVGHAQNPVDANWRGPLARGGYEDRAMSCAAHYRLFLSIIKEGLGTNSWLHERALGNPGSDVSAGIADSQRIEWDNDKITPRLTARGGLRWYKNRMLFGYDMDAKQLMHGWEAGGFQGSDIDGRRMMLTMAYACSGRLLLGNSFRDASWQALQDLARVVPFHREPRSPRPLDAFVRDGAPQVYDFRVDDGWHQLILFNASRPGAAQEIAVPLAGEPAAGALGLDPAGEYFIYDFWNDAFAGRLKGAETLRQTLRPGEARVLSVRRVLPHPQVLSTSRHILQGFEDMPGRPQWDAATGTLRGTSLVAGGDPYRIVIHLAGREPAAEATGWTWKDRAAGLIELTLESAQSQPVPWAFRTRL